MNSRLIVKNIPKNISEQQLKQHFAQKGDVTDVKILFKNKVNRRICFIGYRREQNAIDAQKYFDNSYIQTSKVKVEFAKLVDDQELVQKKVWSKQSVHKQQKLQEQHKQQQQKQQQKQKQKGDDKLDGIEEEKQLKFKEFMSLMKQSKSVNTSSWNDNVLENQDKKQKKVKKENINDNQVQVREIDTSNAKVGMKSQQVHIKFGQNEKDHKVSKQIKQIIDRKEEEQEEEQKQQQQQQLEIEIDTQRLYVLNIPYDIEERELRELFDKYGYVEEIKVIKDNKRIYAAENTQKKMYNKGYCYVTYNTNEEAVLAFSELDNKIVWGRILHIRPAYQEKNKKRDRMTGEYVLEQEKSSYKKLKKKTDMSHSTNWSTLFLNQNTILNYISKKYGVDKKQILDQQDSEEQAVRIALAETEVINETKQFLENKKIDLSFMEENRRETVRSDRILLVKNIKYQTTFQQLYELFNHHGHVDRLLLAPNNSIAIVTYQDCKHAQNVFNQLNLYKYKNEPIYLEWAPLSMENDFQMEQALGQYRQPQQQNINTSKDDILKDNVLFVKNLNFETDEQTLKQFSISNNCRNIKSVKIVKNRDGMSHGYGFIEYETNEDLQNALKNLQGKLLDNHSLQVSVSVKKDNQNQQQQVRKTVQNTINDHDKASTKIVVRNVAFECTKKEIHDLFKSFGEIKTSRLPKKMNGQHRGFAFVEFVSIQEAKNAFQSLQNTHLYGRKLVIEWADEKEE